MDVGLADRLRYWLTPAGFQVIEVDGWQTWGRTYADFAPEGSVQHHTAGALAGGDAPSLGICINGRSDLPGPLCNVFGSRSLSAYVISAGVANHAGPGSYNGLAGNQKVHGLEMEHDGGPDEPRTERLMDFCARIHCAFLTAPGSSGDPAHVCEHFEWSTQGKIDFYQWPGDDLRARVAHLLTIGPNPNPTTSQENDMPTPVVRRLVMKPDGSGRGYVLDARGGLNPVGGQKDAPKTGGDGFAIPYWDTGAAMDVVIVDWDAPSGYTLDARGAVHAWGGLPKPSGGPYWPNAFIPPAPA